MKAGDAKGTVIMPRLKTWLKCGDLCIRCQENCSNKHKSVYRDRISDLVIYKEQTKDLDSKTLEDECYDHREK